MSYASRSITEPHVDDLSLAAQYAIESIEEDDALLMNSLLSSSSSSSSSGNSSSSSSSSSESMKTVGEEHNEEIPFPIEKYDKSTKPHIRNGKECMEEDGDSSDTVSDNDGKGTVDDTSSSSSDEDSTTDDDEEEEEGNENNNTEPQMIIGETVPIDTVMFSSTQNDTTVETSLLSSSSSLSTTVQNTKIKTEKTKKKKVSVPTERMMDYDDDEEDGNGASTIVRSKHETPFTQLPIPSLPSLYYLPSSSAVPTPPSSLLRSSSSKNNKNSNNTATTNVFSSSSSSFESMGTILHIHRGIVWDDPLQILDGGLNHSSSSSTNTVPRSRSKNKKGSASTIPDPSIGTELSSSAFPSTLLTNVDPYGGNPTETLYTLIIQGHIDKIPLAENSLVSLPDGRVIGILEDIFGPVQRPLYLLRVRTCEQVPKPSLWGKLQLWYQGKLDVKRSEDVTSTKTNDNDDHTGSNTTGISANAVTELMAAYGDTEDENSKNNTNTANDSTASLPTDELSLSSVSSPSLPCPYRTLININDLVAGQEILAIKDYSSYIFPEKVRAAFPKGSDASNINDEEIDESEIEYSDDEAEREARKQRSRKRGNLSGSDNDDAAPEESPVDVTHNYEENNVSRKNGNRHPNNNHSNNRRYPSVHHYQRGGFNQGRNPHFSQQNNNSNDQSSYIPRGNHHYQSTSSQRRGNYNQQYAPPQQQQQGYSGQGSYPPPPSSSYSVASGSHPSVPTTMMMIPNMVSGTVPPSGYPPAYYATPYPSSTVPQSSASNVPYIPPPLPYYPTTPSLPPMTNTGQLQAQMEYHRQMQLHLQAQWYLTNSSNPNNNNSSSPGGGNNH